MDTLPEELLCEIFQHLRLSDRLKCSLVCRQWANVLTFPRLLEDVLIKIRFPHELPSAMAVLKNTRRHYPRLVIIDSELLEFNRLFWRRVGAGLKELTLRLCDITPSVLCKILGACSQLQSFHLGVRDYKPFLIELSKTPYDAHITAMRRTLAGIKRFNLSDGGVPTRALLRKILQLMPNIAVLCLRNLTDLRNDDRPLVLPSSLAAKEGRFVELDLSPVRAEPNVLARLIASSRDSLQKVTLRYFSLNQDVFESLARCTNVTVLDLPGTGIRDHDLEAILTGMGKLEQLCLGPTTLGDYHCQIIGQLQRLKHLSLWSCRPISRTGFSNLGNLKQLQHLDLNGSPCNVEGLRALKGLTELTELTLAYCHDICNESVTIICDNFTKLKTLDLGGRPEITDEGCSQLYKLEALRNLTLPGNVRLSERLLEGGVGPIGLTVLSLYGNSHTTDMTLLNIDFHHEALKFVDLSQCFRVSDAGITALVKLLPDLRALNVHSCPKLTQRSLDAIEKHSRRLTELGVDECNFDAEALECFRRRRPEVLVHCLYRSRLPIYPMRD